MGDAIFVKKCKSLQGLLEDSLGHLNRIANPHSSPARFKLRQLLDHGIHTRAHGLKYQALVDAIWPAVLKLAQQSRDIPGRLEWCDFGDVAQDS